MRPQPLRCLTTALSLFLLLPALSFGQEAIEIMPAFPVGSLVAFPQPDREPRGNLKIFIRAASTDTRVWVAESKPVLLPTEDSREPETGVGFVVPQLSKGIYTAWYGTSADRPRQSMQLIIVPQLLADEAINRSVPGGDVEVRIRIFSPVLRQKDAAKPETVGVGVTLQSQNAPVASLADGQSKVVSTDHSGYAVWKVHVNSSGIALFEATAEGFEPVTVAVVGMPASAPTFREAELLAAQELETERTLAAKQFAAQLTEMEATRLEEVARARDFELSAEKDKSKSKEELAVARKDKLDRLQNSVNEARVKASELESEAAAARATVRELSAQLPTLQPASIAVANLKPGDIFLVLGSTPLLSTAIRSLEAQQLGDKTSYSHACLYLGKINGTDMVAEMWSSGYWITPLSVSTKGALIVDVFRWEGIDDAKRRQIAERAINLYGSASNFISFVKPENGSLLPYAFEQIGLLGGVAKGLPAFLLRRFLEGVVDPRAGGRRKMICSEFVVWVYQDMGLAMNVTPWSSLQAGNFLTTDDRRKDYTTPNMIARSASLRLVGRYLGP